MLHVVSDTHFGHGNIIKYCNRPWLTQEEKILFEDEKRWSHLKERVESSRLPYRDALDDLSNEERNFLNRPQPRLRVSKKSVDEMDDCLIENINARVAENDTLYHLGDFCFAPRDSYYYQAKKYLSRIKCRNIHLIWGNHDHRSISSLFSSTNYLQTIFEDRQGIVLCHYAMAVWEKSHRGWIHLYGHSHGVAEQWLDSQMPTRRSMDVGVDNVFKIFQAYRPISYDEVMQLLNNKDGFSIDHHISN